MNAASDIAVVAIDWGTTHLRIWPLDRNGYPVARHSSAEGMGALSSEQYPGVMARHFSQLGIASDVPVIICGMAGSRQGWVEAPYLSLPLSLDRLAEGAVRFESDNHAIAILPGAAKTSADSPDVMRSEETQLAGLVGQNKNSFVCMPGTHTKWADLQNGRLTDFHTSMTGELFHLMESHSILRHSVGHSAVDFDGAVFEDAVRDALEAPEQVVTKLFSLRADGLFSHHSHGEIRTRLSGLLIGLDIAAALKRSAQIRDVEVVGGNALGAAYCKALAFAGCQTTEHDGEALALAGLAMAARQVWPDRFSASMAHQDRANT